MTTLRGWKYALAGLVAAASIGCQRAYTPGFYYEEHMLADEFLGNKDGSVDERESQDLSILLASEHLTDETEVVCWAGPVKDVNKVLDYFEEKSKVSRSAEPMEHVREIVKEGSFIIYVLRPFRIGREMVYRLEEVAVGKDKDDNGEVLLEGVGFTSNVAVIKGLDGIEQRVIKKD